MTAPATSSGSGGKFGPRDDPGTKRAALHFGADTVYDARSSGVPRTPELAVSGLQLGGRGAGITRATNLLEMNMVAAFEANLLELRRYGPVSPQTANSYAAGQLELTTRAVNELLAGDWKTALARVPKGWQLVLLRQWWHHGCVTREQLRNLLPGTWSYCEPDDTRPIWLRLWRAAELSGRIEDAALPDGTGWHFEGMVVARSR